MVLLSPPEKWPSGLRTVATGKITKARKGERWSWEQRGELEIEVSGGRVAESQLTELLNFTKKKKTFSRNPVTQPPDPTDELTFQYAGRHYRVHEDADKDLYVQTGPGQIRYLLDARGTTVTRDAARLAQGSLWGVDGGALHLGAPTGVSPVRREEKKIVLTVPTRPQSPAMPLTGAPAAEREFLARASSLLGDVAAVRESVKVLEPEQLELLSEEVLVYQRRVEVLGAWLRRSSARRDSEVPDLEQVQEAAGWTQELIREHGKKVEQLTSAADGPAWRELTKIERQFTQALEIYHSAVRGKTSEASRQMQSTFTSAVRALRDWEAGRRPAGRLAELLQQAKVTLRSYQDTGPQEIKSVKGKLRNEVTVIGHGSYTRGEETFVPEGCEIHTMAEWDSYVAIGMGIEAVIGELPGLRKYKARKMIPNLALHAGDASETERLNDFLESTSQPVLRKAIAVGTLPLIDKASRPPGGPPGPVTLESGIKLCDDTEGACSIFAGVHRCNGLLARLSGTVILTACTVPTDASRRLSLKAKRETPRTFTDPETKETTTAGLEPWVADQIYEHPKFGRTLAQAKSWVGIFERGATEGQGNSWRVLPEENKKAMRVAQPTIVALLQRAENLWIMAPGVERPFRRAAPRTSGKPAWRADTQSECDALSGATGDFEIHITNTLGQTFNIGRTGLHPVFVYGGRGLATVSVSGGNVEADGEATVTTVSGGMVSTRGSATVGRVTSGIVNADGSSTVGIADGGTVSANGSATVTTVNVGATVYLEGNARVTTLNGGTVNAEGSSQVTTVNGGVVNAAESATVVTLNVGGTVNLREEARVTTNNGGTLNPAA
ncbi:hypothetical protein [Streptomyces sp. NPDC048419]|uniref:hypothetical protein n=1 Tax=Streptomyces sp. NPDC048419 TaxID=3365547 RepID=UPI0037193FB6